MNTIHGQDDCVLYNCSQNFLETDLVVYFTLITLLLYNEILEN